MTEKFKKLDWILSQELWNLRGKINDLGLKSTVRHSLFDKNDAKELIDEDNLDKYSNIINSIRDIVVNCKDHSRFINNLIQDGITTIRALRDQYKPQYNSYWFADYSGDFRKFDRSDKKVYEFLIELLGTNRVDDIRRTYCKFDHKGFLQVQFGIVNTPKTILFAVPGIIDIEDDGYDLDFNRKDYNPESIDEFIPSFNILFDPGFGGSSKKIQYDLTKFDVFKDNLIKLFDFDVNSAIPEKPELTPTMSYESFMDWKLNRIANNAIELNK